MKYILLLIILISFSLEMQAQYYQSAVGIRGGSSINASYKRFVSETLAFEGIMGADITGSANGLNITLLGQLHQDLNTSSLQWYYGLGPSLILRKDASGFGFSGNVGLDYSLDSFPINISIDAIPTVYFGDARDFNPLITLALRYILEE